MSFLNLETSIFGGSPIELYEFSIPGQYWRYTTDDRPTVFSFATYSPVSELSRGGIRVTQNIDRTEIRIELRGDIDIANQFRVTSPSNPVSLKIYKKHRNDSDFIIRYRGRIQGCSWEGSKAILSCVSVHSSLKQPGLRRSYQYQCPYALYDGACGVSSSSYETLSTVTGISGTLLTVSLGQSRPENYFAGGYLIWEVTGGRQETRMITASLGSTVTMQMPLVGLSAGDNIRLYAGCDHSIQTCHAKFANADRFGGFPFIPSTNPFGGTTIF